MNFESNFIEVLCKSLFFNEFNKLLKCLRNYTYILITLKFERLNTLRFTKL